MPRRCGIRLWLRNLHHSRREDIPLLIEHFVGKFNRLQGKDVVGVSDEVLARLMEHDYPGNVRELENAVEHAFVLCRGGLLQLAHLPPELRGNTAGEAVPSIAGMTLETMERLLITDALRRHHGNCSAAAKHLGIHLSDLNGSVESARRQATLPDEAPERRTERLRALAIETLICGAISRPLEALLAAGGIEVIPRICGEAEEGLRAFLSAGLQDDQFRELGIVRLGPAHCTGMAATAALWSAFPERCLACNAGAVFEFEVA